MSKINFPIGSEWNEITQGLNVDRLSIIKDADGNYLYRLGLARKKTREPKSENTLRNARFDGIERTGPALYMNAATGNVHTQGDSDLALQLGERFTGYGADRIDSMSLVTRFGPDYDFRNKRLPVWKLDYKAPVNATIFVDTTSAVLVDKVDNSAKPERLSFSLLHKWNFLRGFGRMQQNYTLAAFMLLMLIFSAGLGLKMAFKRR